MVRRVFHHHDRLIHKDADRNGDARQRHDVRRDIELPHHDERHQHRQRQREANHHRAAEVHQDQKHSQRGDNRLVRQHLGERVNRPFDQPRSFVERDDPHAVGQAGLKLDDLLLDPLRHVERVLAVPHHHDAADRFAAVLFQHAAAELRAEADGRHRAHGDRRAGGGIGLDDDLLDVALRRDPADAADNVLGIPLVNHAAADRRIRARDRRVHFSERDAVGSQLERIDVDLIFDRIAADRGDLRDAGDRIELITNGPILQGAEPAEVLPVPFDGVPEDLTEGRRVGGQIRRDSLGKKRAGQRQPLGNALAGEIEIDVVLEDDVDHREVEFARRPHRLHAGQPLQVDRERIRDLILDLARAAPHPIGEHDHLIFREIGNGVDRRVDDRVNAPGNDDQRRENHDEAIADREFDDFFNHGRPGVGSRRS